MQLTRGQLLLLVTAVGFFALQFVPHYVTCLGIIFDFMYPVTFAFIIPVIVVSTVLIAGTWVSASDPDTKINRRNWCITLIFMLAAAIALTVGSNAYARGLPTGSFAKQFDSSVWLRPTSSLYANGDITERQKMLGNAIQQVVQNGQKSNILAMLGPSDNSGYFSSQGRDLLYCLGPERGFLSIDSEWLLIWLDHRGNVSR